MTEPNSPNPEQGSSGAPNAPQGYDLSPEIPKAEPRKPKPGDPDFVPPVPIIIREEAEPEAEVEKDPDVEKNKAMAILGYICFLIPLIAAPNSKFARYHANQGLMVFILWGIAVIVVVVLQGLIWGVDRFIGERIWIMTTFFSCIFHMLQPVMLVGALAATIYGIVNAANGICRGLPLIGHMTFIK